MDVIECLSKKPFSVIGHRGAAGRAPENTLKAVEYGIKVGADVVEVDVRSTRDGVLVVFHDQDLLRLTGINKRLRELEYPWIEENVRVKGEHIPKLDEVLEAVKDRVCLFVEVKEPDTTRKVVKTLLQHRILGSTALISFYDEALVEARSIAKNIVTGLIYSKPPGRVLDAKKLGAKIALPHYRIASAKANSLVHRLGLKVVVWTVNSEKDALETYRKGADGIASDYPDLMVSLRNSIRF
ncbi:MAG: glycerophosphodiester phosphodiesterase [Thermoprotei archaeon]|nr:MAG: glycerophosphodiester phosphodiesterase [Thermoprotei archaeon]